MQREIDTTSHFGTQNLKTMGERIYRWKNPLWLTNGKLVGTEKEGGSAFVDPENTDEIGKQIIEHCEKEEPKKAKKEK
jgi:hypothetical protein